LAVAGRSEPDPRHYVGGEEIVDLTGESVSIGEWRVHVVGLVLEQKETKETKNSGGKQVRD
jgi:hypothetical protein